jgi:hypothetical protein
MPEGRPGRQAGEGLFTRPSYEIARETALEPPALGTVSLREHDTIGKSANRTAPA